MRIGRTILVPIDNSMTDNEDKKVVPSVSAESLISSAKNNVEIFLDKLSPEIMKAFENPPDFGSVSIEVTYHDGVISQIILTNSSHAELDYFSD